MAVAGETLSTGTIMVTAHLQPDAHIWNQIQVTTCKFSSLFNIWAHYGWVVNAKETSFVAERFFFFSSTGTLFAMQYKITVIINVFLGYSIFENYWITKGYLQSHLFLFKYLNNTGG